jgi:hypothetical protein
MEVMHGHRAPERAQPSIIGGLTATGRFAVLGIIMAIGGDDRITDRVAGPRPIAEKSAEASPEMLWEDADTLPDGTSLIKKKLLITRAGKEPIRLEAHVTNDGLELIVNGKPYTIEDTMNVDVGKSIMSATVTGDLITIETTEHGTARVERSEVKRIIGELDDAETERVPVDVLTLFDPKGMLLSNTIGATRWCRGWKEGDKETYRIGFERKTTENALAFARPIDQ